MYLLQHIILEILQERKPVSAVLAYCLDFVACTVHKLEGAQGPLLATEYIFEFSCAKTTLCFIGI
jgi:hypothetical protein